MSLAGHMFDRHIILGGPEVGFGLHRLLITWDHEKKIKISSAAFDKGILVVDVVSGSSRGLGAGFFFPSAKIKHYNDQLQKVICFFELCFGGARAAGATSSSSPEIENQHYINY